MAERKGRGGPIPDIATRIRLLALKGSGEERGKQDAIKEYVGLVHHRTPSKSRYCTELIEAGLRRLDSLGLLKPTVPDMRALPWASWFVQFDFTLAKPWLSRDDDPFYVADSINPVRKDRVFNLPMISAAAWKGLLRWTAMTTGLAVQKSHLSDDDFGERRFRQCLLFGDEIGEDFTDKTSPAKYLDALKGRDARRLFAQRLRSHFGTGDEGTLPNHAGRIISYPTFFNRIDVEVINPHSRTTRAGTHPVYLECVPAGAKGTFSLLYVPFDLAGREGWERTAVSRQARDDLYLIARSLQEMMLAYGFSAKRTSGYGLAEDDIDGCVRTRRGDARLQRLSRLSEEASHASI